MFISLQVLCGIVVVLLAYYYYLKSKHNFWKIRGVPGPEPEIVFGNARHMSLIQEPLPHFLTRIYNDYKDEPMVGLFIRSTPTLFVHDADLIKTILIKDFSKITDRGLQQVNSVEPIFHHLFNLEEARWRPMRSQISPVFSSGKLKGMFSLILECSNQFESYLDTFVKKGEPFDVREVTARFTTDVIGSCAFGIEMNSMSEKESAFRKLGRDFAGSSAWNIFRHRVRDFLPAFYYVCARVLPETRKTRILKRLTTETMEYREKNNILRPDFINLLLELKKHPERLPNIEITDDLLAAQAFVFFAAGFETSSATISSALYELAFHQDVQDKLRQEIREFDAKGVKTGVGWQYETIKQMKYLEKVFQETLRKYPALPVLNREATEDYTFEGSKVTIPKGTKIWIPIFAIQRDPAIYPDPERFDPERFSEEQIKERHPMHWLPFGRGPRNCIGARFAIYQTKIGLIKILCNYKVEVCEKTMNPYEYNSFTFILTPRNGVYLKVTKLEN